MAVGDTFLSYVALGFGSDCSLLYLIEYRAWLGVLANTVSHSKPSFGWHRFHGTLEHVFA